MTELEALQRVAEAAEMLEPHIREAVAAWEAEGGDLAEGNYLLSKALCDAVAAFRALPAPATPARSRLAALEALHAVVRDYETGNGTDVRWSDVRAALAAVADSPAPAAEPEGEVVEVRGSVWQYPRDKTLFLAGVDQAYDGWPKVADVVVRVPLPRVPEVVGEVG